MPLLSRNVHPNYVQELVGHYSSIGVTLDTYSHVIAGMDGGTAGAMDDALDNSAPSRVRYQSASCPDASLGGRIMPHASRAIMRCGVSRAASYIRTDTDGELPTRDEQQSAIRAYVASAGHELVAAYEDLEAPGVLLYHRPDLKEAINNVKELEDWEVLIVAHPRCISDTDSALHEFVHKFSLYGNRLESPARTWDEFLAAMKAYRREMSQR